MAVELVTGYAGRPHINATQVGSFNAGIFGQGTYILKTGDELAIDIVSNTQVTVGTGDVVAQGRQINISSPVTLSIQNGTQGKRRNDFIGIEYTKESSSGKESVNLVVRTGALGYTGTDPEVEKNSILNGATHAFIPLFRVRIDGISIHSVDQVAHTSVPLDKVSEVIESRVVTHEEFNSWTLAACEDTWGRPGLRFTSKDGKKDYMVFFTNDGLSFWDVMRQTTVWNIRP